MTDFRDHQVDPAESPDKVAIQLRVLVESVADSFSKQVSPIADFLAIYDTRFTDLQRHTVQLAFSHAHNEISRSLSSGRNRQLLPDLLYLGARILSASLDTRIRTEVRRNLRRSIDSLLAQSEFQLCVSCMNMYASCGIVETRAKLDTWVAQIGDAAIAPALMILTESVPREAIEWLLMQDVSDEVILSAFEGVREVTIQGLMPLQDLQTRPAIWIQSQFDTAIRSHKGRDRLQNQMLEMLNGPRVEAVSIVEKIRTLADKVAPRSGRNIEGIPHADIPANEIKLAEITSFEPDQMFAEVKGLVDD